MKKRMKLLTILLAVMLMTGCVKYNISMEIGSDKSVAISVISATASSGAEDDFEADEEEDNAMTKKGYTAEVYKTEDWIGTKYTKTYKNIDDISSNDAVEVELGVLMEEDKEEPTAYFQKKSSLFKTTYIANFTIDLDSEDNTYGSYMESSGAEFGYDVKLPVKSNNNNATTVSEDGKTLTWKLNYGEVNKVQYEFSMVNTTMIIIIVAVVIIAVVGVVLLVMKNKKKNPQQMPMDGVMPMPTTNSNNQQTPMNDMTGAPDAQPTFVNPAETSNFIDQNPLGEVSLEQPMNQNMFAEPTTVQPMSTPADMPNLENQPPIVAVEPTPEVNQVETPVAEDVKPEANSVTIEEPAVNTEGTPVPAEAPVVEIPDVTPPVVEENKDANL